MIVAAVMLAFLDAGITGLHVAAVMLVLVLLIVCPFLVFLYYYGRSQPGGGKFINPLAPIAVVINCLLLLYVIFYDVPKWVLVTVVSLYLFASAIRLMKDMVNHD